jgi:tRNA nucleotidyltransferase/poly(A) polymerase
MGRLCERLVGYDRFSGEAALRQLAELYRALRLYVNIFQPSMKLQSKRREESHVHRKYDAAQTPLERLRAAGVLEAQPLPALDQVAQILDPLQLLSQLEQLRDAPVATCHPIDSN